MKKLFNLAMAIGICLGMASCGGGSSSSEDSTAEKGNGKLQAEAVTEIKGPLGEYFTVADRPITFKKESMGYEITVEVERNDKPTSYGEDICYFSQGKDSDASMCGGFGYEILDEDGDVVAKSSPQNAAYGWDEMSMALRTPANQSNSVTFRIYDMDGTPAKVRLTSDVQKNSAKSKASSSASSDDLQNTLDEASKVMETAKQGMEVSKQAVEMLNTLMN